MTQTTIDTFESHTAVVPVTGGLPTFGYCVFWTVKTNIWAQEDIDVWAKDLPEVMKQVLNPNDLVSSFEKATNLEGTRKVPTKRLSTESDDVNPVFTSRKINSTERILLREVLDMSGKRAGLLNLGTVSLKTETGEVHLDHTWQAETVDYTQEDKDTLANEIESMMNIIVERVDSRSTGVEDQKVRTAIAKWVRYRHGSSLRGHGGVYFIPHRQKEIYRTELVAEIKAIQSFLSTNDIGTIFSFELVQTETFSKDDMVSALLADINSELDPLIEDVDNTTEDTGKRKLVSNLGKVVELKDKVKTLNETFNNRFTHIGIKLGVVAKSIQQQMESK